MNHSEIKSLLTNCTYLEDQSVTIAGVKFYGTPYQPVFHDWAFNRTDDERKVLFAKIPSDADVVMCHGPPFEILDKCYSGVRAGCQIMRAEILNRVKPKLMVFGHIHESYGSVQIDGTTFINASSCNLRYKAVNKPQVFDIPI